MAFSIMKVDAKRPWCVRETTGKVGVGPESQKKKWETNPRLPANGIDHFFQTFHNAGKNGYVAFGIPASLCLT